MYWPGGQRRLHDGLAWLKRDIRAVELKGAGHTPSGFRCAPASSRPVICRALPAPVEIEGRLECSDFSRLS